jgi:nitroreductase
VSNLGAWEVDPAKFPRDGSNADKARFAVRYAILAPSSHNTQPWRFAAVEDELLLIADRSRQLKVIDPDDRELIISCGAALFNLRVAFAHFGVPIVITPFPRSSDPDLVARIQLLAHGPSASELGELIGAIPQRATNRYAFAEAECPGELLAGIKAAAEAEGAQASLATSAATRREVAGLIAQADRRQFADAAFRRELARWVQPSRRDDGMPAYSQGIEVLADAATPIVAMAIRTFDIGKGVAASHEQLARGSPLLVALSTSTDDNEAWLACGQALERVLLVVAKAGYAASYLNQPIEVAELRVRLAELMATAGSPQLLLRIGRGPIVPHSPRRPLADVLT